MSALSPTDLVGKVVQFSLRRLGRGDGFTGLVRSVDHGPRKGLKAIKVQRPSNPDASTLSERYQGDLLKLQPEDLDGVFVRGVLREFLVLEVEPCPAE